MKQFIRWFFSDNIFGSKAEIVFFFSICILLESVRAVEWHYNRGIGSCLVPCLGSSVFTVKHIHSIYLSLW